MHVCTYAYIEGLSEGGKVAISKKREVSVVPEKVR